MGLPRGADNPDVNLYDKCAVVSSDTIILQHCTHWFNLTV